MYNIYTKKSFGSAFTSNTDACSLETGNEGVNFRSGFGIDEEVIDIDDYHHGFAQEEIWIELGRQ